MNEIEKILAEKPWDEDNYLERLGKKLGLVLDVAEAAAKQYKDTYRQAGMDMRFSDVFRKYKRIEGEFLHKIERKREKLDDDIKDLIVYLLVMWIYKDELEEQKQECIEKNKCIKPKMIQHIIPLQGDDEGCDHCDNG